MSLPDAIYILMQCYNVFSESHGDDACRNGTRTFSVNSQRQSYWEQGIFPVINKKKTKDIFIKQPSSRSPMILGTLAMKKNQQDLEQKELVIESNKIWR